MKQIYKITYQKKDYTVTREAGKPLIFDKEVPDLNITKLTEIYKILATQEPVVLTGHPQPTPKPKLAPQVVLQAGIGPSMEVVQAIKGNPHLGKMLTIGFCGLIGFLATYRLNENGNLLAVPVGFALVFGVAVGLNYAFTKQPKPKPEVVKTSQIEPQTPPLPQAPQGVVTPTLTPILEEKPKIQYEKALEICKEKDQSEKAIQKLKNLHAVNKSAAKELMGLGIKIPDLEFTKLD